MIVPLPQRPGAPRIRHVLMTTDATGGVWHFALELAEGLGRQGVEVSLATLGAPISSPALTEARAIPNLRVIDSGFHLDWMSHPWNDVSRAAAWLLELRARLEPDVIHFNHLVHSDLPLGAPLVVTVHSCALARWEALHGCSAPESWDPYRRTAGASLRAADVVTAPSFATLLDARRHHGPFRDSRTIYNARSAGAYRALPPDPIILATGHVADRARNLEALCRIAPRLPWPVTIAGDAGPPPGESAPIPNLAFVGQLHPRALAGLMSRAPIYAVPAYYQPFGLGALEAAHSGCALVLGDTESQREIWDDAAIFVPPGDDEAIFLTLRTLVRDAGMRKHYAQRARLRAGEFQPEAMAASYLDAYAAAIVHATSASLRTFGKRLAS